jgi:hypothetical protein
MKPYFLISPKKPIAVPICIACLFLMICLSCTHRQIPEMDALRKKWHGKPIDTIVAKLGTPHQVTTHPDGEKQYIFQFSEKQIYIDIFRGESLDDMSTIRVQEEIARAEQSKCLLEIFTKNNIIVQMNTSGHGCRKIREKLGP